MSILINSLTTLWYKFAVTLSIHVAFANSNYWLRSFLCFINGHLFMISQPHGPPLKLLYCTAILVHIATFFQKNKWKILSMILWVTMKISLCFYCYGLYQNRSIGFDLCFVSLIVLLCRNNFSQSTNFDYIFIWKYVIDLLLAKRGKRIF